MKKSILFALVLTIAIPLVSNAQLKKLADNEKIRSFTNGSVGLFKTTSIGEYTHDTIVIYSVSLPNASTYLDPIILYLGDKQEMLHNLKDFSNALQDGKKGDSFEFNVWGKKYHFSYRRVLGQRCFFVYDQYSISSQDYGRLFKLTIDDIIEYMNSLDE